MPSNQKKTFVFLNFDIIKSNFITEIKDKELHNKKATERYELIPENRRLQMEKIEKILADLDRSELTSLQKSKIATGALLNLSDEIASEYSRLLPILSVVYHGIPGTIGITKNNRLDDASKASAKLATACFMKALENVAPNGRVTPKLMVNAEISMERIHLKHAETKQTPRYATDAGFWQKAPTSLQEIKGVQKKSTPTLTKS